MYTMERLRAFAGGRLIQNRRPPGAGGEAHGDRNPSDLAISPKWRVGEVMQEHAEDMVHRMEPTDPLFRAMYEGICKDWRLGADIL